MLLYMMYESVFEYVFILILLYIQSQYTGEILHHKSNVS